MIMKFVIKDVEQIFFIRLAQGVVEANLGEPSEGADLTLSMVTDIFDGLF
jgi:hypothetical protein